MFTFFPHKKILLIYGISSYGVKNAKRKANNIDHTQEIYIEDAWQESLEIPECNHKSKPLDSDYLTLVFLFKSQNREAIVIYLVKHKFGNMKV